MKKVRKAFFFPIGLKMVVIFSFLVIVVLGTAIYMVSTLVRDDERIKAEENNHTINGRTAEAVENILAAEQHNAAGLLNTLSLFDPAEEKAKYDVLLSDYCARNGELICISGPDLPFYVNPLFLVKHPDAAEKISAWFQSRSEAAADGTVSVQNMSALFAAPSVCIFFPYKTGDHTDRAFVAFSAESLIATMSTGSFSTSFLVNSSGSVIVHPDFQLMTTESNMLRDAAIKSMIAASLDNSQNIFPDERGERYFCAYHRIPENMFVVTKESERIVYEAIDRTTFRIFLFSCAILFLAIVIIRFFSRSITRPVGRLVRASHDIETGNFNPDIKPSTHDEIGLLTGRFIDMGRGLAERERLRSTFRKFTNNAVAERAMKGDLVLGGETKEATIFFSDIRSFTAMSEKLEPQQVVSFLNEYMTRMVACVNKTGGVVDKFIGDSIMAVWGTPDTSGSPGEDALNSVKAALLMRSALYNYNKAQPEIPPVRIGCGINTGSVVAGQIGSSERMEYTVIGDAVNLASRTESLNKPFATDILITENTYNLIKTKIIAEEMPSVHVKGKEAPLKMYAVISMVGVTKGPQSLNELRLFLGLEPPDLTKVDTDAEEKKFKISK
jgi:adenylate cyclase